MNNEFKAPKVGDTVNHVAANSRNIIKAKVVAVDEKTGGRAVTVEVPKTTKNADGDTVSVQEKVTVTFREKESLAGHTWHWALIAVLLSLCLCARANIPTYHTYGGAGGNSTYPSQVIFPADPNSQIRVVSVFYSSDLAGALLNFSSGTTEYSLVYSNCSSTTLTNVINSTNGLSPNAVVILQHNGIDYTNYVSSFGNTGTNTYTVPLFGVITNTATTYGAYGQGPVGQAATNVNWVIMASSWGYQAVPGDDIYLMGTVSSLFSGGITNSINGDDIFSGNYGRPVLLTLGPSTTTNRISSASAHYDSASY